MLYLASKSPRRRQLLDQLGQHHAVLEIDVPEVPDRGESPEDYVRRVAREKARAGLAEVHAQPGAIVIAADTEVVLDGQIYGKPRDDADAAAMLRRLSARTHFVLSAVCVADATRELEALDLTEVTFAPLDEATIAAYVASGEPHGKAGAYGIQGRAGAFIARVAGSYTGVMGLPVFEAAALLREFGL